MMIFEDIERAAEESGATIVIASNAGVTVNVPDLVDFARAVGARNTEWDEEASRFLAARTALEGTMFRFEYTIDFEGEG